MSVSERLRAVREHLGKTQREMSSQLSLGVNTWQTYERDINLPSAQALLRLADLGFSLDWLATGEGTMLRAAGPTKPAPTEGEPQLDEALLADAIEVLEEWLAQREATLSSAKKARAAAALYEIGLEDQAKGRRLDRERARIILRLLG